MCGNAITLSSSPVRAVPSISIGAHIIPLHHIIPKLFSPEVFPIRDIHARYTAVAALFAKT